MGLPAAQGSQTSELVDRAATAQDASLLAPEDGTLRAAVRVVLRRQARADGQGDARTASVGDGAGRSSGDDSPVAEAPESGVSTSHAPSHAQAKAAVASRVSHGRATTPESTVDEHEASPDTGSEHAMSSQVQNGATEPSAVRGPSDAPAAAEPAQAPDDAARGEGHAPAAAMPVAMAPLQEGAPAQAEPEAWQQAIRYEWTSVDCWHAEAPACDALGRFEDRWYVCHNYYDTGRAIASLREDDLVRVDDVLVRVSWIYYGSNYMSYSQARAIVGADSYCFQTCTRGDEICVAVCYPA